MFTVDKSDIEQYGLQEALFIGWLNVTNTGAPISMAAILKTFGFWSEEQVYCILAGAESKGAFSSKKDGGGYIFSMKSSSPISQENNKTATILENNIKRLQQNHSSDVIAVAAKHGLSDSDALTIFDKFVFYIKSQPDKYYKHDLLSYWQFWVNNSRVSNNSKIGKRAQIESNVQNAADNWLKKKLSEAGSDSPTLLTRPNKGDPS